ncbi:MAG: DUF1707 domain-containing protein [Nocardia sp.]|nr:DUF1707 domain-containing protein [Nocardia sp.]
MATEGLRARDSDRADICGLLDIALAEGQLTPDEHEQRTAAAMRAQTFGDLEALIDDLQIPGDLVKVPVLRGQRRSRRWAIAAAVAAAALVLGAAAGLTDRGTGGSARQELPDTTTAAGIAGFVAVYRAEFGDTIADEVSFYPEHVSIERYDAATRVKTSYTYRDGEFDGWTTSTGRRPEEPTLDLAEIDLTALAGLLAGATATANAPGGAIGHISAQHESSAYGEPAPILRIFVDNEAKSGSGHFEVGFDGEPLVVHPID